MRKFEKKNKQAGGGCVTGTAKAAFGMLGVLFLSSVSGNALAQCVATTDCAALGYNKSSCPDGGVKCPFGNAYYCPERCEASYQYTCTGANEVKPSSAACSNRYEKCDCNSGYEWNSGACKQCASNYKYTCTGSNESAGADSCGGKYSACQCAANYEWNATSGKCESVAVLGVCTGKAQSCSVGQILNNDGSCSNSVVSGKTPIGVVVYISGGTDKCGYAMTASPIATSIIWSTEYVNTGAFQSPNWQEAIKDFDVSGNMTKIIQSGNSSTYPAAYAALNYAPSAAPTSKGKWMLPTAGILNSLYTNLNAVNNTISKLGGTQLTGDNEHIWSSSEYSYGYAWVFCTYGGAGWGGVYDYYKGNLSSHGVVRPVLAF